MGVCGAAPIAHLLLLPQTLNHNKTLIQTQIPIPIASIKTSTKLISTAIINPLQPPPSSSLPNRRVLLSLLLLVPTTTIQPTSSYALPSFDPVTSAEREASAVVSRRVAEAVELLEKGKELQAQGDFNGALGFFTLVVNDYKDFAFSDYARVGRALALYEVGDRDEAIAEMEDVSISLKGYPEVHAALAAALYVDKNAPLLAENQFTIATLLDPHYTDLSYVRETKHWPPSLVSSLQHFITLS